MNKLEQFVERLRVEGLSSWQIAVAVAALNEYLNDKREEEMTAQQGKEAHE